MRIDFPKGVRKIVAGRAGYRCSFPDCGRTTIGPGFAPEETTSIGTASHIYSASPSGPRGQQGLSPDEVKSTKNAIWLCSKHARLIDENRGDKYPAPDLLSYKDVHEARVSWELEDLPALDGWVDSISILGGPLFANPVVLRLGKTTVFRGRNGVGKTALCEWTAGAFDPRQFGRWWRSQVPIKLKLGIIGARRRHSIVVDLKAQDVAYSVDDEPCPYNPLNCSVVFLRDHRRKSRDSDAMWIANCFGSETPTMSRVFNYIATNPGGWVTSARAVRGSLRVDLTGSAPDLLFGGLSVGEQTLVLVECAITLARLEARHRPTVLILDGHLGRLDEDNMQMVLDRLSSNELRFQAIVVHAGLSNAAGWQVYDFEDVDGTRVVPAIL